MMKPLWLRALPYVLVAVAVLASHVGAFFAGADRAVTIARAHIAELEAEHQATLHQVDREHRTALQAATDLARAHELAAAERMAAMDLKFTKERNDAKARHERELGALRDGALRVRERFTCADRDPGAGGEGTALAAAPGVGDAPPQRGLQRADAEFLLRIGAEADEVTAQLQACQAIVREDRADASGALQP